MRNRYKRIWAAFSGLTIATLIVAAGTFIHIHAEAKRTSWPDSKSTLHGATTVIVLGMGPTPTHSILDRTELAAELWHQGFASEFIASGGQGTDEAEPEAKTVATDLVTRGVPAAIIQEEDRSKSTFENLVFSHRLLVERGLLDKTIVIVTHDFHAARAASIASSLGIDVVVISSPGMRLNNRVRRQIREVLAFWKWKVVGK